MNYIAVHYIAVYFVKCAVVDTATAYVYMSMVGNVRPAGYMQPEEIIWSSPPWHCSAGTILLVSSSTILICGRGPQRRSALHTNVRVPFLQIKPQYVVVLG